MSALPAAAMPGTEPGTVAALGAPPRGMEGAESLWPAPQPAPPPRPQRPRLTSLATTALGLAGLAGVGGLIARAHLAAAPHRDRVLVTRFTNETGDSTLAPIGVMAADWIVHGLNETGLVGVVQNHDPSADVATSGSAAALRALPGYVWLDMAGKAKHVSEHELEFTNGPPQG